MSSPIFFLDSPKLFKSLDRSLFFYLALYRRRREHFAEHAIDIPLPYEPCTPYACPLGIPWSQFYYNRLLNAIRIQPGLKPPRWTSQPVWMNINRHGAVSRRLPSGRRRFLGYRGDTYARCAHKLRGRACSWHHVFAARSKVSSLHVCTEHTARRRRAPSTARCGWP